MRPAGIPTLASLVWPGDRGRFGLELISSWSGDLGQHQGQIYTFLVWMVDEALMLSNIRTSYWGFFHLLSSTLEMVFSDLWRARTPPRVTFEHDTRQTWAWWLKEARSNHLTLDASANYGDCVWCSTQPLNTTAIRLLSEGGETGEEPDTDGKWASLGFLGMFQL